MKNLLLCLYFFAVNFIAYSQTLHDFSGKPFMVTKYSGVVEGSAFFKENFLRGTVITEKGEELKNQQLRLNLLENLLNYQDDRKQEMIATTPVKEVILFDTQSEHQFSFIHSDFLQGKSKPDRGWYEKLHSGKTILLKQYKKELKETPAYGSSKNDLSISTQLRYFVLYEGEWKLLKKLKGIADILVNNKSELLKYVKDQKLDMDLEDHVAVLLDYYDSLQ